MISLNKLHLNIVFLGIIFGIITVFFKGTVIMLGVITITGVILWNFLPPSDKKFLVTLFIAGISLRIIILAIFYIITVSLGRSGEFIPDSRLYSLRALGMIKLWEGQPRFLEQVQVGVGENGYLYILIFFYKLLGFDSIIINPASLFSDKLINCLIGTMSGMLIFYIAKDIFGKNVAKVASFLVVFFPSLILWSMTNNRDTPNIFLVCLILFCLIRFLRGKRARYLIIILFSLFCLSTIRPYILSCMIFVIGISCLFFIFSRFKQRFAIMLFIVSASVFFLGFTGYGKKMKNGLFNLNNFAFSAQTINNAVLAQGGSVYRIYDNDLIYDGIVSGFKLVKGFSKGWFYFMLVPFPWAMSSALQILSYPQIIIWYFLLFFAIIGIIVAIRHRLTLSFVVLSYLFIVTSGFALMEANVGSVLRHRDLITPAYFIFTAVGLVYVFNRRELFE